MDDIYYELKISVGSDHGASTELIRGMLIAGGCDPSDIVESRAGRRHSLCIYFSDKKMASALHGRLKKAGLKNVSLSFKVLYPSDWRDKWKRSFKPFSLTRKIRIVPLWRKDSFRRMGRRPIFLDTVSSFGTGLHETTRFMAGIIDSLDGRFESVFDIGTGTGILSLVARHYGAKSVYLTDIDPHCIEAAKANFAANGMEWDWSGAGDFRRCRVNKTFDLVLANIITDELIALREKLIARVSPGKYLAVSGISVTSLARFKRAFQHPSLRCLKIFQGKKWCALLYRKLI